MKKKKSKSKANLDNSTTKAAAEAFHTETPGMMPPNPIQLKEDEGNLKKVKSGIDVAKDIKDYAEYGDGLLQAYDDFTTINPTTGDKKSIFKAGKDHLKNTFNSKIGKPSTPGKFDIGGKLNKAGKAMDVATAAISTYELHDAIQNDDTAKTIQSGADLFTSTASLIGGPAGAAFSFGYGVGTTIDKTFGVSDAIYNSTDLKNQALNESTNAKLWKSQGSEMIQKVNMEKRSILKIHMININSLESSKKSVVQSLSKVLSLYPNKHKVPSFPFTMPDVEAIKKLKTVRDQTMAMVQIIPKLKLYQKQLSSYIEIMGKLIKIAADESGQHHKKK